VPSNASISDPEKIGGFNRHCKEKTVISAVLWLFLFTVFFKTIF
jgi:hypothetical protein